LEQAPSSASALADAPDTSKLRTINENLKCCFFIVTSFGQE